MNTKNKIFTGVGIAGAAALAYDFWDSKLSGDAWDKAARMATGDDITTVGGVVDDIVTATQFTMTNPLVAAGMSLPLYSAYRSYREAKTLNKGKWAWDNALTGGVSSVIRASLFSCIGGVVPYVATEYALNRMKSAREQHAQLNRIGVSRFPYVNGVRDKIREGIRSTIGDKMGERFFPLEIPVESYLEKDSVKNFIKIIRITQKKAQVKDSETEEYPYQKLRDALTDFIPGYDQDDITETDPEKIINQILTNSVNAQSGMWVNTTKKDVLKSIEDFGGKVHFYDDVKTLLNLDISGAGTIDLFYSIFTNVKNRPLLNHVLLSEAADPLRDKLADIIIRAIEVELNKESPFSKEEVKKRLENNPLSFLVELGGTGVTIPVSSEKSMVDRDDADIVDDIKILQQEKLSEILDLSYNKESNEGTLIIANKESKINDLNTITPSLIRFPGEKNRFNIQRQEIIRQINSARFSSITEYEDDLRQITATKYSEINAILNSPTGLQAHVLTGEQNFDNEKTKMLDSLRAINETSLANYQTEFNNLSSTSPEINNVVEDLKNGLFLIPTREEDTNVSTMETVGKLDIRVILKEFFQSEQGGLMKYLLEEKLEKDNYVDISSLPNSGGMRQFNEQHDTAIGGKKRGVVGVWQSTRNAIASIGQKTKKNSEGEDVSISKGDRAMNIGVNLLNVGLTLLAGKELFDSVKTFKK